MAMDRDTQYRHIVSRGKYRRLYRHLCALEAKEWRTTFGDIEKVMGAPLPPSARTHRPWWGNQRRGGGHSQALAWSTAGWETAEVDMDAESLLFRRMQPGPIRRPVLDEIWPAHPTARWPEGLSLRRRDIYGERA